MREFDYLFYVIVFFLILFGLVILGSIAPQLFPIYFVYVIFAISLFFIFSRIDFEIITLFSRHLYTASVLLLILTLIIGQITRGAVRWIPVGPFSIQPAEIARPFLFVFFADYMIGRELNFSGFIKAFLLFSFPFFLIIIQPSLGVAILTFVGFLGTLILSNFKKRYLFIALVLGLVISPFVWRSLAPYQRQRVLTFLDTGKDPYGAGYNSLQSKISVGSGKLFGRGLGKGVQTQLAFLPERQTDFIFASISEELGFLGIFLLLTVSLILLWKVVELAEFTKNPKAKAYIVSFYLAFLSQIVIHSGMNMGLLPITGVPYPLVSAGGSSLVATMIGLGIAKGSIRR